MIYGRIIGQTYRPRVFSFVSSRPEVAVFHSVSLLLPHWAIEASVMGWRHLLGGTAEEIMLLSPWFTWHLILFSFEGG